MLTWLKKLKEKLSKTGQATTVLPAPAEFTKIYSIYERSPIGYVIDGVFYESN